MKTTEFISALKRIVDELHVERVLAFLSFLPSRSNIAISPATKNEFADVLFDAAHGYRILQEDKNADLILKSVHGNEILAPDRLANLTAIYRNSAATNVIFGNVEFFGHFISFYELMRSLTLLRDTAVEVLDKSHTAPPEQSYIEIELADYDGDGIEIDRIERFASAIAELYERFAILLKAPHIPLKINYIDSGSNVLFSLSGASKIIDSMRDLLREIWNAVQNRKFDRFDKLVDSISKGLTLTKLVQDQIDSKVLDANEGETIKEMILTNIKKLFDVGAMPAKVEVPVPIDRQALLTEKNVKLLEDGKEKQN
jgi:hypothetical protein